MTAGETGRFTVVYEAGPLGVAAGGMVFLQISPFWGWSTPQTLDPALPGFTRVTTEAAVELEAEILGEQLLGVLLVAGSLVEGDRLTFEYGAGERGARVDRYAESESRLWIAVDGDGDGVRSLVNDSPHVAVSPAAPAALVVTAPTTARPGDTVRLTVAAVDALGNGGVPIATVVRLRATGSGLEVPEEASLTVSDQGTLTVELVAIQPGLYRVEAETAEGLVGLSNPLFVNDKLPRVLWADLHGHSGLSDGTGTPQDYYRYARDVAALDVVALTDHDHWGMQPLARNPELWRAIQDATERYHEPDRFVTVPGYEWTSWLHGHRHVLYFDDDGGPILSSVDPQFEHPLQLWDALRGSAALTFAHHSAGEPIPTNWDVPPDPELEPITEVVSVHGSSEAADSPGQVRGAVPGNFVRDALDRGYRLGMIGSGDSHDGHPGLAGIASPSGGLAALWSDELTREAVRSTLQQRAVYATSGQRILLHTTLDGKRMGSELPGAAGQDKLELIVLAIGTQPIRQIDIVRSGAIVESVRSEEPTILQRVTRDLPPLSAGEYLYVRVIQADGGVAWSSPFFAG